MDCQWSALRIGAEGMGLSHGDNILIADTPTEFARQVIDLFLNQTLWAKLSIQGKKKVMEQWSPEKVSEILARIFTAEPDLEAKVPKRRPE